MRRNDSVLVELVDDLGLRERNGEKTQRSATEKSSEEGKGKEACLMKERIESVEGNLSSNDGA